MNLCISNGNKCDSQMFVTRTADANLETVKQPLGHDGLKSIANVKKKRFKKKCTLHVLALIEIWWVLPSLILQFWGKLSIIMWLLLNFGCRNSNPWKEKDANVRTHPENKAAPLIKSNLQSVSSAPAVWIASYFSHSSFFLTVCWDFLHRLKPFCLTCLNPDSSRLSLIPA